MGYKVRAVRAEEWRELKELRLAALADPVARVAFFEQYESAVTYPDEVWQQRAREGEVAPAGATFVREGEEDGGSWAGMLTVRLFADHAVLVGVYMRPGHRGTGLAAQLFDAAARWCWEHPQVARVLLHVHEDNPRAEAFYARRGFRRTGERDADPSDPRLYAYEMELVRPA